MRVIERCQACKQLVALLSPEQVEQHSAGAHSVCPGSGQPPLPPAGFGACVGCATVQPLCGEHGNLVGFHQHPDEFALCPGSGRPPEGGRWMRPAVMPTEAPGSPEHQALSGRLTTLEAEVQALRRTVETLSNRTSGLTKFGGPYE